MKHFLLSAIVLFALLAMTGCNLFEAVAEPTLDPDQIQTLAAGTVQARQTISSLETKVAYLTTQPSDQPAVITATPRPPTSTPWASTKRASVIPLISDIGWVLAVLAFALGGAAEVTVVNLKRTEIRPLGRASAPTRASQESFHAYVSGLKPGPTRNYVGGLRQRPTGLISES